MPAPVIDKPARNRQIITWDDFRSGEFGSEAPWRAPKDSFTGLNVLRYVDGSLGPRNGLISFPLTGISPTGLVLGMGLNDQALTAKKAHWFVIGTAVHFMTDAGAGATAATALASSPSEPPQSVQKGLLSYVSVLGDKLYKFDHLPGTPTVTAVVAPNSPGLRCLAQYGEHTIAAGGSGGKGPNALAAPTNRVFYSAAGNPESWPAGNFFDVGDTHLVITGLIPQRTHLVITTSDGSWWLLTNTPAIGTLRRAATLVSLAYPQHAVEIGNGNVGYTIASSTDNGSTPSLGEFSGSTITMNEKINFGNGRLTGPLPSYQTVALKNRDDWFVAGGPAVAANSMALFQHGSWSLHQWQVSGKTLYAFVNSQRVPDGHLLTDGGGASATPTFYKWRSYNNRPAFTTDTGMQPGDASTTPFIANFTLPEWYAPDGREVGLVEVVVDFTSWNTGSGSTNHFDLQPNVLRTFNGGAVAGPTPTFDQAGSASAVTTAGTRQRKRFSFGGLAEGNGFNLAFGAVRGVAIQKVQAHIEFDGPRF